ncbi:M56 family metallopeptidase [Paenibacillus dendritiformis]
MMSLAVSLIIASFVGTGIWILESSIKPVTKRVFSQTWHYYSSMIPVFFLIGGTEIINRLIPALRSVLTGTGPPPASGTIAEQYAHVTPLEHTATNSSLLMRELFDYLVRFDRLEGLVLSATLIWAVGTIVFLGVNIKKYRAFKQSVLQESWICHAVRCPVKVIVSTRATTPMVIGLWKPVVVLPNVHFEDKRLAMILSHELVHIQRGDLLVKLLMLIANAVHWFNPAAYWLNKQINTLCELSCDEKVVKEMDMENRRFYGETLLSMLEYGVMQKNVVCTSSLCNTKKSMKRRLLNLMNVKKTSKSTMMLSLVAAIALVGSGGFAAYAAGSAMPSSVSKEVEGFNVSVEYPDGKVESFDKDGNRIAAKAKVRYKPKKLTTEEIVERTKKHIEKGLAVPQGYIDDLPQRELDALNETYGFELQKSK